MPKIPEEGGEPEALSAGQIKMLTKEAKALAAGTQNTLKELLAEAGLEGIAGLIAGPVLQKLHLAIASINAQHTAIELAVENKNGDVPTILKELLEAKKEAAKTVKIMKAQLFVARSCIPAADAD